MQDGVRAGSRLWRKGNRGRADGVRTEHRFADDVVVAWSWRSGKRPVIALVHGIGMGQEYYGLLRAELQCSFDIIAVDLPGFGDSPEPADAVSMPRCGELVGRTLDELGCRQVVLVGHSMGTQVVAELAAARPDLIEKLILIAPTVDDQGRRARTQVVRMLRDLANDHPKVGVVGLAMYAKAGPRWFIRQFHAMMQHRLEEVAPKIRIDTLVIRGEEDLVCPRAWVERVATLLPHAQLRIASGKGHEAMITSAQPVAGLIGDFALAPTHRPGETG